MWQTHDISDALNRGSNGKIPAIKHVRVKFQEITGMTAGLLEAKNFVEEALYEQWRDNDEAMMNMFMEFIKYDQTMIDNAWARYAHRTRPIFGADVQEVPETPTIYMGKLVGWRAFSYYNQKLAPVSFRSFDFDPFGLNVDDKPEPDIDNEYGFWAFKSKADIIRYLFGWSGREDNHCYIYCPVSLSGTVIEHEKGYRAQKLEILSMYAEVNNSRRRGIANKLGWPGKVYNLNDGPELFDNTLTEIPDAES